MPTALLLGLEEGPHTFHAFDNKPDHLPALFIEISRRLLCAGFVQASTSPKTPFGSPSLQSFIVLRSKKRETRMMRRSSR